jgi:hypothetical protein
LSLAGVPTTCSFPVCQGATRRRPRQRGCAAHEGVMFQHGLPIPAA